MKNKKSLIGLIIILALVLIALLVTDYNSRKEESKTALEYKYEQGMIFGTSYHITYESPNGESLKADIEQAFKSVDNSLSMFNPNSIISKINQNDPKVLVDSLFEVLYLKSVEVSTKTNGAFDMTVAPLVNAWGFGFKKKNDVTKAQIDSIMRFVGYQKIKLENHRIIKENPHTMLDASAIAKGFGCDVTAAALRKHGVKNYIVEIGGEVALQGVNPHGKPWRIGINKPIDDSTSVVSEIQDVVELTRGGMATSGNYRNFYIKEGKKFSHTIDPKTGYPVQHSLLSATIIASDCMSADAYATACMVMGLEKSLQLCRDVPEIEGYFIYHDANGGNKIVFSDGFENYLPSKKK